MARKPRAAIEFAAAATLCFCVCLSPARAATDDAIAVVGGGVAGTVTCLTLLLRGHTDVTVYESSPDLTSSTSSVIAGTVNFDTHYRFLEGGGLDVHDALAWIRDGLDGPWSGTERFVNFVKNAQQELNGARNGPTQRRRAYRQSYERMLEAIAAFPRLCSAFVGDWCCRAGDEAAGYLEDATGVACSEIGGDGGGDSPFGRFELLSDRCDEAERAAAGPISGCDDETYADREACEAAGHGYQDGVEYWFYGENETLGRVGDFVGAGDGVRCSVVAHRLTGYVRTEELFKVLGDILDSSPSVSVLLGCEVTELSAGDGAEASGKIKVTSACGGSDGNSSSASYDKVVVAASTASVPLLSSIDPSLDTNLLGFRGHGIYGRAGDGTPTIGQDQIGRSVHFVRSSAAGKAAYARSTVDGKVKIWGGLYPDPKNDDVRPPYSPPSDLMAWDLFVDAPAPEVASALFKSNDTVQTGVRPVPSIGNVPLIKQYSGRWSNLFLNTGYGFNGYDLAFFASGCVVSWLDDGKLTDVGCRTATTDGAEENDDFPLWAIVMIAVVGALAVLVCCCFCFMRARGKQNA